MTLGELFEETYIQGEIAIRSYDSTGTTIEHYLGNAEEFYPDAWRTRREGHSNALMLPTSANAGERSEWRRGRRFAQTASRSCSVRPFTEGTDAIG